MSLRTNWRRGDRFLVRYKDESIVVVDKTAPLFTVAPPSGKGPDLIRLLREFFGPRRRSPLFVVHRLDRVVSGLLVVARTKTAFDRLVDQFRIHDVERRYLAVVRGRLEREEGTYESQLTVDPRTLRMYSDPEGEKRAVTHYRVRDWLPSATLVDVELETGARNQIRVHFAEAGHPLLGERKYLDDEDPDSRSVQGRERIFLHARVLGFRHPTSGEHMRFESPLPPDLSRWLRSVSVRRRRRARR
ncbi:MAG: RluA family pseudouridine synthase [Deltaproteobacteria bacterium]|nr:RluA family pseudouridine synthase [Deltaproteobacteria bacterium]